MQDRDYKYIKSHTMIPGTAGGTLLLSIVSVYFAIVSGEAFSFWSYRAGCRA